MPFVDNRGVRIHYEVVGEGSPLVIEHGFSDSIETWYESGYVDALKATHRLANYWGYSMGGRIGFALARYAPKRFRCFVIGGAAGVGLSRIGDGFRKAIRQRGVAAIPDLWAAVLPESLRARLLANDAEALEACRVDSLGFADELPAMTMPCLLYAGSVDPIYPVVEETVAEMPNARFFTLPGLGHAEGLLRSELVLPQVTKFLDSVP
jgi:pimeloyl-ACP methyl ester carboxylesterase